MPHVRYSIPSHDNLRQLWIKRVTDVTPLQANGYDITGQFVNRSGFLPNGTLLCVGARNQHDERLYEAVRIQQGAHHGAVSLACSCRVSPEIAERFVTDFPQLQAVRHSVVLPVWHALLAELRTQRVVPRELRAEMSREAQRQSELRPISYDDALRVLRHNRVEGLSSRDAIEQNLARLGFRLGISARDTPAIEERIAALQAESNQELDAAIWGQNPGLTRQSFREAERRLRGEGQVPPEQQALNPANVAYLEEVRRQLQDAIRSGNVRDQAALQGIIANVGPAPQNYVPWTVVHEALPSIAQQQQHNPQPRKNKKGKAKGAEPSIPVKQQRKIELDD